MGNRRRVVITGVGPVTPVGIGADAFWQAVRVGMSGVRALDTTWGDLLVRDLRSRIVASIRLSKIPTVETEDRVTVLARLATQLARTDAGLGEEELWDAGIFVGTAVGSTAELEQQFYKQHFLTPIKSASAQLEKSLQFHTTALRLASMVDTGGPVLTVSTGCTAGLDAIGMAADAIRSGDISIAVAVGSDAPICPVVLAAFDVIGALSCRNHDPRTASRPFDRDRDGFVLGEGAAAIVLEDRRRALARGARIYGEIKGYSSVNNQYHMTDLPADGEAMAECIQLSLSDSDTRPNQVGHVNAHGSSTQQNDLCETNAIKNVCGDHARQLTVNSLKAMIGHALGASNAIEIAACALSLYHKWHFPTLHLDCPAPGCDLDYLPHRGRPMRQDHILKLSSGFSGIHSAMLLGI